MSALGLCVPSSSAFAQPSSSNFPGTATVDLNGPTAVSAGSSVQIRIEILVAGENLGLGGFAVDVVSPVEVSIPPFSVSPELASFSAPTGISNRTPSGQSLFGGTIGTGGRLNQVGGMQNIFGVTGSGIATSTNTILNIATTEPAVAATTSFVAPTVPGQYCIIIENPQVVVIVPSLPSLLPRRVVARLSEVTTVPFCFSIESAPPCDPIDFNNDGLFPSDEDLIDFVSVFAGGSCITDPPAGVGCNDIDFDNNGLFPTDEDLLLFLAVLAGGPCP